MRYDIYETIETGERGLVESGLSKVDASMTKNPLQCCCWWCNISATGSIRYAGIDHPTCDSHKKHYTGMLTTKQLLDKKIRIAGNTAYDGNGNRWNWDNTLLMWLIDSEI
jgi:hypothetical protein